MKATMSIEKNKKMFKNKTTKQRRNVRMNEIKV